jgi:hypothetical protein
MNKAHTVPAAEPEREHIHPLYCYPSLHNFVPYLHLYLKLEVFGFARRSVFFRSHSDLVG